MSDPVFDDHGLPAAFNISPADMNVNDSQPPPQRVEVPPPPQPFGPWATIGLTVAILGLNFLIGIGLGIVTVVLWLVSGGSHEDLESALSGQMAMLTGVSLLLTTPVTLAATYCVARLCGFAWRDYVNLDRPRLAPTIISLLLVTGFVALESVGSLLVERPVPQFMVDVMTTSSPLSLLLAVVGIIILAPIGEEVLFRGFMFRGLQRVGGGSTLAVLLTAALFAAIHVQYEAFEMGTIFLFGLLLGIVRARTGSTTLCILLHAAMNSFAVAVFLLFLQT